MAVGGVEAGPLDTARPPPSLLEGDQRSAVKYTNTVYFLCTFFIVLFENIIMHAIILLQYVVLYPWCMGILVSTER